MKSTVCFILFFLFTKLLQAQNDSALYNSWTTKLAEGFYVTFDFIDRSDDPVDMGYMTLKNDNKFDDCGCNSSASVFFDWKSESGYISMYFDMTRKMVSAEANCTKVYAPERKAEINEICKSTVDEAFNDLMTSWGISKNMPYSVSGNTLTFGNKTFTAKYQVWHPVNQEKSDGVTDQSDNSESKNEDPDIQIATVDAKNGYQVFIYDDGTKYEGEWKDDQRNGQGKLTWTDGTVYSGAWINNYMHGQGTYTWPNGNTYTGEFKYDKMEGTGTYTSTTGDTYTGEWSNSKRNGKGTFKGADGSSYTGEWENNYMHGKGIYISPAGVRQEGTFSYGEFVQ